MAEQVPRTSVEPCSFWKRHVHRQPVIALIGVGIMLATLWITRVMIPLMSEIAQSPIDEIHESPGQTQRIRIRISDQGALGYGGIRVHKVLNDSTERLLWTDDRVVAEFYDRYVNWISETTVEVMYIHADKGTIARRLSLDP